jgi:hypothetical protein
MIDLQVEYLDEMKQRGAAKWIQERVARANERLFEAEQILGDRSIQYFLAQFKEQRDYQSKPMTRKYSSLLKGELDRLIIYAID